MDALSQRLRALAGWAAWMGPRRVAWRLAWTARERLRDALDLAWSAPSPAPHRWGGALEWRQASPWLDDACGLARQRQVQRWASLHLDPQARDALARRARDAAHGRPWRFDQPWSQPLDWHQALPEASDPRARDARWSSRRVGTAALWSAPHAGADIKLTWEPARFGHAQDMARAWCLGLLPQAPAALVAQLMDFSQQCPAGRGVHWASAQEVAWRALSVLWSCAILAQPLDERSPGAFAWLAHWMRVHAVFLHDHLNVALHVVPNNHVLVESCALLALSLAFKDAWPEADAMQIAARATLRQQIVAQLEPDGGYIQRSHNYHRVAIQALMWAHLALDQDRSDQDRSGHRPQAPRDAALVALIERACVRSSQALEALRGLHDGRLPVWGAQDGALLMRWSCCPHQDMRPWLQAMRWVGARERALAPGPWDEALLWLAGEPALRSPQASPRSGLKPDPEPAPDPGSDPGQRRAVEVGLDAGAGAWRRRHPLRLQVLPRDAAYQRAASQHVLRVGPASCAILTAPSPGPFGQDDWGHVEIIHDGHELALDAGSYRYQGDLQAHRWAHGALSHNLLTCGELGHRLPASHFAWGGVARWGQHTRVLARAPWGWRVEDRVQGARATLRLHWLLAPLGWSAPQSSAQGLWRLDALDAERRPLQLLLWCPWARRAPALTLAWRATHYASRQPATSLSWLIEPPPGLLLIQTDLVLPTRTS